MSLLLANRAVEKILGGAFDPDAQAFITAAVITDTTQQNAINTLVVGLKADNLWIKMKAIYPIVGGTASQHKYNLKDPRDLDAAFRLTYNGTLTHSATGEALTAANLGWGANTHLNENTIMSINDMCISIYSRTNLAGLRVDIGCDDGVNQSNIFPNFNNIFYPRIHNANSGAAVSLNTQGFFVANRVNNTQVFGYKNTTKYIVSSASTGKVNAEYWLHNIGGTVNIPSTRELSFATIGDGLTDTNQSNLYTLVQAFQTTLSRQV